MKALIALLAIAVVAALAGSAAATPPGRNGKIAFTRYAAVDVGSGEPRRGAIFITGLNGKGERQLTRPPTGASDFQPDWSPDGSRIVFERQFEDKPFEIWSVKPDGSGLRRIEIKCPVRKSEVCDVSSPAWSPDGRRIAFGDAHGKLKYVSGVEWIEVGAVSVVNADGSHRRQLTQLKRPTSSEDFEPVWSPDGRRIAFQRENSTAPPRNGRAIFVVNASGGGVKQVTPWRLDAGDHPDWSPDGRTILFHSPSHESRGSSLFTVRPDGRGLKQLTRFASNVDVHSASYSPDGKWIVFSRTGKAGQPDLFVMRSNGTQIRQLTRTAKWDSAPDWGPRTTRMIGG
jgi:TolB protein